MLANTAPTAEIADELNEVPSSLNNKAGDCKHIEEQIEEQIDVSLANNDDKKNRGPRPSFANYYINGIHYSYAKESIFWMQAEHPIRKLFVRIKTNFYVHYFFLFIVILNSTILAVADFRYVDNKGNLLSEESIRNLVLVESDPYFVAIFVIEAVIKIVAMGFYSSIGGSYLNSPWNWIDFAVCISGITTVAIQLGPGSATSRAIRSLRPVKILKHVPGIEAMIDVMIKALPELGNVLIVLFLVCIFFAVAGVSLFGGPYLHTRCRLTPYPVTTNWTQGADAAQYRCTNENTFNIHADYPSWTKASSVWAIPKPCYWPIDNNVKRMCALTEFGNFKCPNDRWCGSNYDALGNKRFLDLSHKEQGETFIAELNYGYTSFDSTALGYVVVFLVLTNEGWSDIMNIISDGVGDIAVAYVILLVGMGGFGFMQLFLAVIEQNFAGLVDKTRLGAHRTKKGQGPLQIFMLRTKLLFDTFFNTPKACWNQTISLLFQWIEQFVDSYPFDVFVNSLVIINALILSMEHYPATDEFNNALDVINFILIILFSLEFIFKVVAKGLIIYLSNEFNILDALVLLISWLDIVTNPAPFLGGDTSNSSLSAGTAIRAMRMFRMFRMFKVMARHEKLRVLLEKLAMTGMQLYANKLRFDEYGTVITEIGSQAWKEAVDRPLQNFDDFPHAFASVFQILTIDKWTDACFDLWRAVGASSLLYSFSIISFGVYILLKVFLAILLGNFGMDEEELIDLGYEDESEAPNLNCSGGSAETIKTKPLEGSVVIDSENRLLDMEAVAKNVNNVFGIDNELKLATSTSQESWLARLRAQAVIISENANFTYLVLALTIISSIALAFDNPLDDPDGVVQGALRIIDIIVTLFFLFEFFVKVIAVEFYSSHPECYCKDPWNWLDMTILVISILSLLAPDPNLSEKIKGLRAFRAFKSLKALRSFKSTKSLKGLKLVIDVLILALPDVCWTLLLCLFFYYIFAIFCVSFFKGQLKQCTGAAFDEIISQTPDMFNLLVYPKAWNDMSNEQQSWFGPLNPVTNSSLLSCTEFNYPMNPCCSSFSATTLMPTSRMLCECWGASWDNVVALGNFDNIAESFFLILQISTLSSWGDVMYATTQTNGIDMQPVRDQNIYWIFFFIVLILVVGLLSLNMFIGVLCDNFKSIKEKKSLDGRPLMQTPEQFEWCRIQDILFRLKPLQSARKPDNKFLKIIFEISKHPFLLYIEVGTVLLSVIGTGLNHFGQSDSTTFSLQRIDVFCSIVFWLDLIIKMVTLRKAFFSTSFNIIDLVMCVVGDAFVFRYSLTGADVLMPTGIVRLIRFPKVFKFLETFPLGLGKKGPVQLISTLLMTLPGIFNVGCVLFLLIFIFTTMGMQLFAKIAYFSAYNDYSNFRSFLTAFKTMIELGTLQNWSYYMASVAHREAGCVVDPDYDTAYCGFNDVSGCIPLNGCGTPIIYPFLLIYVFCISLIVLNLFVGVVLDAYSTAASDDNTIKTEDLRVFRNEWTKLDPDATGLMSAKLLPELLCSLPKPLGLACDYEKMNHNEFDILLKSLKLHMFDDDNIDFRDLIVQLSLNVMRNRHNQEFFVPKKKEYIKLNYSYSLPFISSKKSYVRYETEFDDDDPIFEDKYPAAIEVAVDEAVICQNEGEVLCSSICSTSSAV